MNRYVLATAVVCGLRVREVPINNYRLLSEPKWGDNLALHGRQLSKLRSELLELRLMALHAKGVSDGVSGSALEDAMEDDDPKEALIEFSFRRIQKHDY